MALGEKKQSGRTGGWQTSEFYSDLFWFKLEADDKIQDGRERVDEQTVATLYFLKQNLMFLQIKKKHKLMGSGA